MTTSIRPHRLGANRVPIYYAGGDRIDAFRRERSPIRGPEDWVGSVSAFPALMLPEGASPETGISVLEDGRSLRSEVADDAVGWLGPELSRRWDGETGLLVKLLDAGERLPVHCHPSRPFAAEHLASPFGKTEGWIVMDDAAGGEVWLGFREDVDVERLRAWIDTQAVDQMLAAMNQLPARPGDVFYVPAGVPHSIGPGVMITELQEPTSFSILAEYATFGLDVDQATLDLGWATALGAFDRSGYGPTRLPMLMPEPAVVADDDEARVTRLFAAEAAEYFQGLRVEAHGTHRLAVGFSVLVVERGAGRLAFDTGELDIAAGQTWVVPFGAGPVSISGDLRALVCLPPVP